MQKSLEKGGKMIKEDTKINVKCIIGDLSN